MTKHSNQNLGMAEGKQTGIEQPARRKLVVRRETLKGLTLEPGSAAQIKGGIPQLTNNARDPYLKGDR